jgi:rhodanese-related sulfurtransferase
MLFMMCGAATLSMASEQIEDLPTSIPGVQTISATELVAMMAEPDTVFVIDARIAKGRQQGYIETSLPLPDIETNCESLEKLVPNVDTRVVFYCSSNKCGRSMNSVKIATACGYRAVYWFRGGFEEWKNSDLPYVK